MKLTNEEFERLSNKHKRPDYLNVLDTYHEHMTMMMLDGCVELNEVIVAAYEAGKKGEKLNYVDITTKAVEECGITWATCPVDLGDSDPFEGD